MVGFSVKRACKVLIKDVVCFRATLLRWNEPTRINPLPANGLYKFCSTAVVQVVKLRSPVTYVLMSDVIFGLFTAAARVVVIMYDMRSWDTGYQTMLINL